MDWQFPYPSTRVPVLAANCVATSQPLATQAGLAMLARGGSAVDAILAAAITLTVVEPAMNGIGGDAFAILADGRGGLVGLNASGRSPAGWTPERFAGRTTMPATGWDSVTVPGAVSAWVALHDRFGRLPFEALFEPAIHYARDGFLVTPAISEMWQEQVTTLGGFAGWSQTFLVNGRAPRPGELFRCLDQAVTLALIAETKGETFYRGALAEKIAATAKREGGALALADLAEHKVDWMAPIGIDFKGYRIHEMPPNGQGLVALIALGILDRLDTDDLDIDSAEFQHLVIEAIKLGFADARAYVADPAALKFPVEELLAPAYLDERARLVRRDRSSAPVPGKPGEQSTVYLAAADASGMMISYIQSNFRGFGSGIVVPGTGIALHNRGAGFVLDAGHPNEVGPRKRPLHTILPAFATRDGAPLAAFGVMGGVMQPQGHVQVATRLFGRGMNPQAAIDAPRWRLEKGDLMVEAAWPAHWRKGLSERGHVLVEAGPLDVGASQAIWRLADGGYVAASESRRDGQAAGF